MAGPPPKEDTVFYKLFVARDGAREDEEEAELTCLAVRCSQVSRELAQGHLWHYQAFELEVCSHVTVGHPPHLQGSLCYRDNVEDEWLVVWLLLEISKHFPNLVISVKDEDGDFVLIETAHYLPRWLTPSTSENRVFLHRGCLHLIPKPHTPAEIALFPVTTPTITEAIELVRDPATPTEATQVVQEALQHRISCFPDAIWTNLHHAHCYVPWSVGHMMSCDPTLVAAAVHVLCDRGPDEMRTLRSMTHFKPSAHPSLMSLVTFTRCLYAKLLHLRFAPPPHSGFSLAPPTSHAHKAHELGMKLTCGLELVIASVAGDSVRGSVAGDSVRGSVCGDSERGSVGGDSESVWSDSRWKSFLKKLQGSGYFKGEVEGSHLHQQLLTSAKDYFLSSVSTHFQTQETDRDPVRSAGMRARQLMASDPGSEEEMRIKSNSLPAPDDDSWMEISPAELDAMMRRAAGYTPDEGAGEREGGVRRMVDGVTSFVDTLSSHEGAELPWNSDGGRVEFDPDVLLQILRGRDGQQESESELSELSEDSEDGEDVRVMMEAMDSELKEAGVKSAVTEEEELGLVRNLLTSLAAQSEAAGPASNILHSLGIPVPNPD